MGLQIVRYDRVAKHTHARTNQRRFLLRARREGLPSTVTFELRPDSVRKPVSGKSLTGGGSSPPEMGPHLDGGQGRRHRDEMLLHQWFGHSFPGNPRTSPVLFQEWRSQGGGPPYLARHTLQLCFNVKRVLGAAYDFAQRTDPMVTIPDLQTPPSSPLLDSENPSSNLYGPSLFSRQSQRAQAQ